MTDIEIDRLLEQTPCLCGAEDTWHIRCYRGKSPEQVKAAYRRVYARIRRRLAKQRREAVMSLAQFLNYGTDKP